MTEPTAGAGHLDPMLVLAICLVGLAGSAFFSGCETGYMSVSRVRLRRAEDLTASRVARLLAHLRRIEDPITTCLIGTNLFNVMVSAVATAALTERYGHRGEIIAVAVVSVLVILFGEILPKVLFREFPERLTVAAAPVIGLAMGILAPVRWLLRGYSGLWQRILPPVDADAASGLDRHGLAALLLTDAVVGSEDRHFAKVLDRYLRLAGRRVSEIMRPLDDLVSVGPDATVAECLATAARSGHSRLPITREDGRHLHGYVLVRDLLFMPREDHERIVPRRLWRSFLLVDERLSPYELFEELRGQARQLAVVVDADGNAEGMVTLEDLIETVMGSILDEFDAPPLAPPTEVSP